MRGRGYDGIAMDDNGSKELVALKDRKYSLLLFFYCLINKSIW